MNAVNVAFSAGKNTVKLYFMLGLPTETYDDVAGIAELAQKVVNEFYKNPDKPKGKGVQVSISVASFVPKPFTPFQWSEQNSHEEQTQKRIYLEKKLKQIKAVQYKYHESKVCFIEAALARGDRRLSSVLLNAFKRGCKLDGWNEHFNYAGWCRAFEECGLSMEFYAHRSRNINEILPWDTVSCGVNKAYLINEYKRSLDAVTTKDCRQGCTGCGMNKLVGGVCPCEQ